LKSGLSISQEKIEHPIFRIEIEGNVRLQAHFGPKIIDEWVCLDAKSCDKKGESDPTPYQASRIAKK
jgi:hypothetical protein